MRTAILGLIAAGGMLLVHANTADAQATVTFGNPNATRMGNPYIQPGYAQPGYGYNGYSGYSSSYAAPGTSSFNSGYAVPGFGAYNPYYGAYGNPGYGAYGNPGYYGAPGYGASSGVILSTPVGSIRLR